MGPASCYAVTAPGLEPFTARELSGLGIAPGPAEPGGVSFYGTLRDLARANLRLRTASRILLRLGQFHARALGELERKAALLPWSEWLDPGTELRVRVTCHKSRLYHQRAIAERVLRASGCGGAAAEPEAEDADGPPAGGEQLVVVRVLRDEVIVSLDSSGELLHRRGYRLATGKAPLRETLAAALLMGSGWDPSFPLLDPFCGSGTIPIEAALIARGIAPGLQRDFAFRRWRRWDASEWVPIVAECRAEVLPGAAAPILAADRDAGAIRAARANAERAGVEGDISFETRALSGLPRLEGRGHLVSNPPYGARVGEVRALRDLYAALGRSVRERLPGWSVTLLCPTAPLERATGLQFTELFRTRNGGIAVRGVRLGG